MHKHPPNVDWATIEQQTWDVIIVGGGLAGLSAAIYLGRGNRKTLVIDSGKSMAKWEPDVQNYLGFPAGVSGDELLKRGREQGERYHVHFVHDEILEARHDHDVFELRSQKRTYHGMRLLLATGIHHIPPDLEGVADCLGHSMFFCKDCDAFRVQGKRIMINGSHNEAVEYALGMLMYSSSVAIVTNGIKPHWDSQHNEWLKEYKIPVYDQRIRRVDRCGGQLEALEFADGRKVMLDALFTTRGDVYFNKLARDLDARMDQEGQIIVDSCQRTSVQGLYAAGCVTPENCQMIIAAGDGARAAQAINRDLFEESLRNHLLKQIRVDQLDSSEGSPPSTKEAASFEKASAKTI
jgi:thioredoxin reductase (NADPH)